MHGRVERVKLVRRILLVLCAELQANGLVHGEPRDILLLDHLAHVELETVVVILVLLPDENDEVEVVPHVVVVRDVPFETAGARVICAVELKLVDPAYEALAHRVGNAVVLLRTQVGEGIDDDTEDDVEQNDQHDEEVEVVENGAVELDLVCHVIADTAREAHTVVDVRP